MKKVYALVIILIALSVGAFALFGEKVYSAREQIQISEQTIFGNKKAAEGIELLTRNHFNYHLFWETTCYLDDTESINKQEMIEENNAEKMSYVTSDTKYSFSAVEKHEKGEMICDGVVLWSDIQYGYSESYNYGEYDSEKDAVGLQKAFKELMDSIEPGETTSKTIYLKDYYTYYPLGVSFDLENLHVSLDMHNDATKDYVGVGTSFYIGTEFKEFFRIPVLESDSVNITVSKSEALSNGSTSSSLGIGSGEYNYYQFETVGAVGENTCYFTIDNRKKYGDTFEYVDMSLIPGGYGIYAVSYETSVEGDTITPNSLNMVFPLEKETIVWNMSINEENSRLLVFTSEGGTSYVRVIDLAAMEEVQKIKIDDKTYEVYDTEVFVFEDFLVVYMNEKLAVISHKNNVYTHEFTVDMDNNLEEKWFFISKDSAMDFDGEKLAIVGSVSDNMGSNSCDFYLTVYDKTGMLYWGEYESSISGSDTMNYYNSCYPMDNNPYKVLWK